MLAVRATHRFAQPELVGPRLPVTSAKSQSNGTLSTRTDIGLRRDRRDIDDRSPLNPALWRAPKRSTGSHGFHGGTSVETNLPTRRTHLLRSCSRGIAAV